MKAQVSVSSRVLDQYSPLLRNSIYTIYQYLYASTLARYPQPAEAEYRLRTAYTA